jgi:hypothetical protein
LLNNVSKESRILISVCNENNDKVISTVDTVYLQKWLKQKKTAESGRWKFFHGNFEKTYNTADTSLVETIIVLMQP